MFQFFKCLSLRNVKRSSNIIFPPYPMLHKAQLLMSSSLPAHNQSVLFLMDRVPKVWQIDLHCIACPKIVGNTHHSRSGRVRVVRWVILEPNPPCAVLCCWKFLPASIYQKSYQSEGWTASLEWEQAPSPNQIPAEEAAEKINRQTRYVTT